MPMEESSYRTPWRHRRFWRLFRRKKPVLLDMTYSYQYMMRFPRLPITIPPLVPTLMSYRWNDEDDCEPVPKKFSRDHQQQQHVRRRLPKRFSDIVGPSSSKPYPARTESLMREKPLDLPVSPRRRSSAKGSYQELSPAVLPHHPKIRERIASLPRIDQNEQSFVKHRHNHKTQRLSMHNAVDVLAHRMQAAMSTELMNSLDRNFVFCEKKASAHLSLMNRSQSFNQTNLPLHGWHPEPLTKHRSHQLIPRVQPVFDEEDKSIETIASVDEPTPDYDEEVIVPRKQEDTDDEIGEEPAVDYDDSKPSSTPDHDDQLPVSSMLYDLGVSSSFTVPLHSVTPSTESSTQEYSSIPPTPPPLPVSSYSQQVKSTVRYRTIADQITANHKLILRDSVETTTTVKKEKKPVLSARHDYCHSQNSTTTTASKSCNLHLSKEILSKAALRKVSHPVSRSFSSYGSMSQLNDRDTELTTIRERTSFIDEPALDVSMSSGATSIVIDNDSEHKSSSKIYNDYKRRASLISVPTTSTLTNNHSHSAIIHPMHTHIGLRSATSSSSAHEKLNETNLSNKQMNVCVINQLNEHLSTRFRKQQPPDSSSTTANTQRSSHVDHRSYDEPPEDMTITVQSNVYDEPHPVEENKHSSINFTESSVSSVPPPPPPLPVGGFRTVQPYVPRPCSSQRTSITTLPREGTGSDAGCNTGNSTISSKLSDTRILRELRTNPLFTKAKQHLEIEPGSHGRRSGRRLAESNATNYESYIRLNNCTKVSSSISNLAPHCGEPIRNNPIQRETLIMHPAELNVVVGNLAKRSKSMNSTGNEPRPIQARPLTKSVMQAQCRKSELEIIFQKRAQRSEQNLT